MKTVYLEPSWKHNHSVSDLISNPPDGYQFILDSGLDRALFRGVSKLNWTYDFQSWLGTIIPLPLVKSHLERLKRVPKDTGLTYAVNHLVIRKEPWILGMEIEAPHLLVWIRWDKGQSNKYRGQVKKVITSPYCKKLICGAEVVRRAFLSWLGGELENKIEVVYWGSPPRNFVKQYDDNKKIKLLFVNSGNINTPAHFNRKGGSEVLEAFLELNKRYSNLELVIRSGLPENVKRQYGQKSNIKIIDRPIAWEELEKEWKLADIFVFPTRVTPAKVFMDAMSYELPIVTTDVWANPELVDDGRTGLLVNYPPASRYIHNWIPYYHSRFEETFRVPDPELVQGLVDRISMLIEKPELRRRMGEASRYEVEEGKFSIEKRNQKLKRIFDEATA